MLQSEIHNDAASESVLIESSLTWHLDGKEQDSEQNRRSDYQRRGRVITNVAVAGARETKYCWAP